MKTYNISCEITLDAETPLDAAKLFEKWLKESNLQYYVQEEKTKKLFSVDLDNDDDVIEIDLKDYYSLIEK